MYGHVEYGGGAGCCKSEAHGLCSPFSRWYQRTAIVVWPRSRRIELLGFQAALGLLSAAVNGDNNTLATSSAIIGKWSEIFYDLI